MRVGIPSEIKSQEFRVGMTPAGARELVSRGHEVLVQASAGTGSGFADEDYLRAGAATVADAAELYGRAELLVKVKEPQPAECALLREGQVLFAYLHLAPDEAQLQGLLASGVTAIAYETVRDADGRLPLLAPMSEVAGRVAVQAGAHCLEKAQGGAGILLGGVSGVDPGRVLVLGGGVAGLNAARMALGLEAEVTVVDRSLARLRQIDELFGGRIKTLYSTLDGIEQQLRGADLVIGSVLVPGAAAPRLVSRAMLAEMKPGSVLADIAIDQGGCFESSRPTTHQQPTYEEAGIIHYCVANIPSAVARTATLALTNATLPYVLAIAERGWCEALRHDAGLLQGLNVHRGEVACEAVARDRGRPWVAPASVLE